MLNPEKKRFSLIKWITKQRYISVMENSINCIKSTLIINYLLQKIQLDEARICFCYPNKNNSYKTKESIENNLTK